METPLRVKKDTLAVIHPHKKRTILKLQYALKCSKSSAVLKATKDGWPTNPTRKSETARQNSNVKVGERSSRVFHITSMMVPFPNYAVRAKIELKTHDTILAFISGPEFSQKTTPRKKHVKLVVFMMQTHTMIHNFEVAYSVPGMVNKSGSGGF